MSQNCPGGCESIIKYKFFKKKNTSLDNLTLNCTNNNHDKPNLFQCQKCDLIFSEFVNTNFLSKYEEVNDEKYISQIKYKEIYFNDLLDKIKKDLNSEGNTLEIGSYYGVFSNIAKKYFKNLVPLELSNHAREYSKKKYNLEPIGKDPIDFLRKNKNNFENILMFDVIEHLDQPFKLIKEISKSLKKGGKFIFTTYDMDTIVPKLMGRNYHWIMPMHKYYFSYKTLNNYLLKENLKIYKTIYDERKISFNYLFYKLGILIPFFKPFFSYMESRNILINKNIKINLRDLKIFFVEKI